jgi:hypothetical protein
LVDGEEKDAFYVYITTERYKELRVSGLLDNDDTPLREIYIDVPWAPAPGEKGARIDAPIPLPSSDQGVPLR